MKMILWCIGYAHTSFFGALAKPTGTQGEYEMLVLQFAYGFTLTVEES